MPIEALPGYLQIEKQEQATPRKYTGGDVFSEGISSGFNEHTFSYLADISTKYSTSIDTQEISEEEFYKHPSYRPGMKWSPGMNYDLLNLYSESYADQQRAALVQANTDNFYIPYFAGGFLAGATDPINYLPIGLYKKGAGMLVNAVRAGTANAAIETLLHPVVSEAYEARGQEYTTEQFATNLMFAFGAGSAISTVMQGSGKLLNMVPAVRAMGHPDDTGWTNIAAYISKNPKEFAIDNTTREMVARQLLQVNEAPGTNVKNTNPFVPNFTRTIDSTGEIHTDAANARTNTYVTTSIDVDNVPTVRGSTPALLKIINELSPYLSDTQVLKIIRSDQAGAPLLLNKQQIKNFVDTESKKYGQTVKGEAKQRAKVFSITDIGLTNFTAGLDTMTALRTRDGKFDVNYEIEYDLKNPTTRFDLDRGIGKMYRIEAGPLFKRTLLDVEEAKKIYRDVFEARLQLEKSGADIQGKIKRESEINTMSKFSDTSKKAREAMEQADGRNIPPSTAEQLEIEFNKTTIPAQEPTTRPAAGAATDQTNVAKIQEAAVKLKNQKLRELLENMGARFSYYGLEFDAVTGRLKNTGDVQEKDPNLKKIAEQEKQFFITQFGESENAAKVAAAHDKFIKCSIESEGL